VLEVRDVPSGPTSGVVVVVALGVATLVFLS